MRVSELFYGLQGEGPSIGAPAVFVRLAGCNLECKWCDTLDVWKRGFDMTTEEVAKQVVELAGGTEFLDSQRVHVVITGGEPLLHHHDVVRLVQSINQLVPSTYFELETNGTIASDAIFYFQQVNCSPKLSSTGESLNKRLVGDALIRLADHPNVNYKFVVTQAEDWHEVVSTFGAYIDLARGNIFLMPAALTREELVERSPMVWELAAENRVKLATRLQTITWSNMRGK